MSLTGGQVSAEAKQRLAHNITALREAIPLSKKDLADRVGVNPSQISLWENADSTIFIGAENIGRLAEALGVDMESLFSSDLNTAELGMESSAPTKEEITREAKRLLRELLAQLET